MRMSLMTLLTVAVLPAAAHAQFQIDWYTIDGGGGPCLGGAFNLTGTIGQPDAGAMSGGPFGITGGFWSVGGGAVCYANCDGSTSSPALNVNDFVCFQARFAASDPYANCDNSTVPPVLNVNDFVCFQSRFAGGCP